VTTIAVIDRLPLQSTHVHIPPMVGAKSTLDRQPRISGKSRLFSVGSRESPTHR